MSHHNAPILPQEKSQALSALIRITQNLLHLADSEAQALMQNDLTSFAILQDEKSQIAEHYAAASKEFRARIEEFRGADRTLLNRLEALQKDLGEKTSNNNTFVSTIYSRALLKTQSALITAQELGQRFGDTPQETNDNVEG